jgi:hypothetical protein
MRLIASVLLVSAAASAQDAANIKDPVTLLAKAHSAFVENQRRERYWNWTTIENRSILDKSGKVIEKIPSITVDSPIRSDGKRCNAVLAWGDGREPYLVNARADERCALEQETPSLFRIEAVLESRELKVESRDESSIALAIHQDKDLAVSADPVQRCIGSLEGTIQLDAATFFPKRINVTVATNGCEQGKIAATDHYNGGVALKSVDGYPKGTVLQFEYALQKDKTGNASKDFWICVHEHSVWPLQKNATGMLIAGRLFKLASKGADRQGVIEVTTKATELSAESMVKFETEKDR